MDRTPYLGDVAVVVHPGKKEMGTPLADTPTRPVTRHGGMRDLHESSFSLSGKAGGVAGAGGVVRASSWLSVPCEECWVCYQAQKLWGLAYSGLSFWLLSLFLS